VEENLNVEEERKMRSGCKLILMLIVLTVMVACATKAPKEETSLYDRLGGREAIQAVVNDFVDTVGADERITN